MRIERYKRFDWKKYFLRTFGFLLVLDIIMLATIPQTLTNLELLWEIAISLWVMLLVCVIFTPLIGYWYKTRQKNATEQILLLEDQKRLRRDPKRPPKEDNDSK
jgi:hypothetical protein